jgi:hypothetical protein
MEARTRENYTYYLDRHILPAFGSMRLIEILPADVREWVTELKTAGLSPTVIRSCFASCPQSSPPRSTTNGHEEVWFSKVWWAY